MVSDPRVCTWSFHAEAPSVETILPDGCRDVIVTHRPGRAPEVTLSALDLSPRRVGVRAGVAMRGYRLRPGTFVDMAALREVDAEALDAVLPSLLTTDADLEAMVDALALGMSPAEVASCAGVSIRSLQRRFRRFALPSPDTWRMLGRARRAAHALDTVEAGASLASLAAEFGYSDQAHLTRAFTRWFGAPPRHVVRDAALRDALAQSGLGGWTGEQSSTR